MVTLYTRITGCLIVVTLLTKGVLFWGQTVLDRALAGHSKMQNPQSMRSMIDIEMLKLESPHSHIQPLGGCPPNAACTSLLPDSLWCSHCPRCTEITLACANVHEACVDHTTIAVTCMQPAPNAHCWRRSISFEVKPGNHGLRNTD